MIAGTLKGIVSQRLVRTADGNGRVACFEILVMTGRVHDMILDPKLTGELPEVVAEGGYYGMQTFDQHLLSHLQTGRITYEDALRAATSPHDFKLMVAAQEKGGRLDGPAPTATRASRRRRTCTCPRAPAGPRRRPPPRRPARPACPAGPARAGAVGRARRPADARARAGDRAARRAPGGARPRRPPLRRRRRLRGPGISY